MDNGASYSAADPEFDARVRHSFSRQGLMATLGARIASLAPGACEIRAPYRSELSQQDGYFHAGVTGAIADSACGYAAFSLMPSSAAVLTVEYKLNLVAPARGSELVARAQVIRSGRTLTTCRAEVHCIADGKELLCAAMLSTIITLTARE